VIDRTLEVLLRLAAAFGPVIALLLVATLLGATLIFLYLILEAGEQGVKLFFPFVKNILLTLISERQHEHAAIKVEFSLHVALILLF